LDRNRRPQVLLPVPLVAAQLVQARRAGQSGEPRAHVARIVVLRRARIVP